MSMTKPLMTAEQLAAEKLVEQRKNEPLTDEQRERLGNYLLDEHLRTGETQASIYYRICQDQAAFTAAINYVKPTDNT